MTAFNQKLLIRIIKTSNKNFREVQGGRRPHPKKALKDHLVSAVMLNCGSQLFAYFFEPLLRAKSQELNQRGSWSPKARGG